MSIVPDYMLLGSLENLNEKNSIVIGSILAANLGVYAEMKLILQLQILRHQ
ncbi:MAG: hypothetical protein CM15mP108_1740 [Gammaproteobacteria bacterium]|nr:MAG: hypothetical protein CM15mP108_1740 [Gammaproteobacteria bacterium]